MSAPQPHIPAKLLSCVVRTKKNPARCAPKSPHFALKKEPFVPTDPPRDMKVYKKKPISYQKTPQSYQKKPTQNSYQKTPPFLPKKPPLFTKKNPKTLPNKTPFCYQKNPNPPNSYRKTPHTLSKNLNVWTTLRNPQQRLFPPSPKNPFFLPKKNPFLTKKAPNLTKKSVFTKKSKHHISYQNPPKPYPQSLCTKRLNNPATPYTHT